MDTITVRRLDISPVDLHPSDLRYIAYSGQHDLAHGVYRGIDLDLRPAYHNKYVFQSVIIGGINKLRRFLSSSAEKEANDEKHFLEETMLEFLKSADGNRVTPRELFETSIVWCEELVRLSLLGESLEHYNRVLAFETSRYPDLHVRLVCGKANVLATMGRFEEAESLLRSFIDKPYILTDRNSAPRVMLALTKIIALRGNVSASQQLAFQGLRRFYTDRETRKEFFQFIRRSYRRSYRMILDSNRRLVDRFLFAIHWLFFRSEERRAARIARIDRFLWLFLLGILYYLSFVLKNDLKTQSNLTSGEREVDAHIGRGSNGSRRRDESDRFRAVLVTRAMGGIGDLLMITPGLRALKKASPDREIHLAVPRRYFPLFQGNPDIHLLDIDRDSVRPAEYHKWINLSECPAARVESKTAPRVRRNRIEIFARALGVARWNVRGMERRPRYSISPDEAELQKMFWKAHDLVGKRTVGVQLHSEESYRDYPFMKEMVRALAKEYEVLVFDGDSVLEPFGPHTIPVCGMGLREAFAIASGCDIIVCPDSSFVHLAAAFDIPCVALFGPIDGAVRTADYPRCVYIDARRELGCLPCWRNESIPCNLTGMRMSVCLASISISRVMNKVRTILEEMRV
jgi:ADP-heptose:LPS heptosyltransferase